MKSKRKERQKTSLMASFDSIDEPNQVLFEQHLSGLKMIFNRPEKLNTITYEMIDQMYDTLKDRENDSRIKVLILKGKGRAFCAGVDIAKVFQMSMSRSWTLATKNYRKVLTLTHLLATYRKPIVSLLNGIVMGGGAGLSMHGTFRVATENAVFAMPEVLIGYIPDVGASHFLTKLPGFYGEYLGLTGASITGSEMAACGLATHFVLSKDLILLEKELCEVDSSNPTIISNTISNFVHKPLITQDIAYNRLDIINKCFSKNTIEEILSCLEDEVAKQGNNFFTKALISMKKASPLSLKASLRLIRQGRAQTVEECLLRDYTIGCNLYRLFTHNCNEGVRAMVIDKDRNPKWEPSKLELVTEEMVDMLYTKPDDERWEILQFPVRPNSSQTAKPKL